MGVFAQQKETVLIKFSEFQFELDCYDPDEVIVEYDNIGMKEYAYIKDKDGNTLETLSVKKSGLRSSGSTPYVFVRSKSFGETTVEFQMNVSLYSSGSFRQINSYEGGYLGIATSITTTRLEGSNHNAWSPDGFPTTELHYAFNGTLVAEVNTTWGSSVSAELIAAGFSVSNSKGSTTYFRRSFHSTGIVKLYP